MNYTLNETQLKSLYAEDTRIEDPVAREEAVKTFLNNL